MAEGGLLDFLNSPGWMGLLSAVGSGLAGARRGGKWNALGSGLLGGVQGYAQGQDLQRQNEYATQRGKLFDMQAQQLEAAQAAAKADAERQAARDGYLSTVGRVTNPRIDAQPNTFDPLKWRSMGGSMEEAKLIAEAPNLGRAKIKDFKEIRNPDGSVSVVGFDEFGNVTNTKQTPFKAPDIRDFGGYVAGVDPITGKVSKIGDKTMTPGEIASNAVARGNLDVSRQRLAFDQGGGADGGGGNQAVFNKQFGKAPAGFRWKPDGSMEFIPGGPADQKAQLQKAGEGTVGTVIAELRDKYNVLDRENAIVSEGNRWGTNIGARIGSTGIGQTLSGAVGTKAQSARDSIAMTRPLLLQAIMKATGMSAKQMDSNAELKMYLATATDPTLGLEANRNAMDQLEKLYGGGGDAIAPSGGKPAAPKPQGKTVVKTGTFNGRKVVQYSDGTTAYVD